MGWRVGSLGEAGKQRLHWLWAALGGERNLKLPKLGVLGGRSICQKREWRAGGWNGSCWHGANPWSKGRQQETQQKRTLLHFNLVYFYYWEWNKNIFILKNATVWNKHNHPPTQNPLHQSVLGCLTLIKKKLGEWKAVLLQTFKGKGQSWWKSPVARVCFRQQTATGFPSRRENPCVISTCFATQVGPVTSWFGAKKYLIILKRNGS